MTVRYAEKPRGNIPTLVRLTPSEEQIVTPRDVKAWIRAMRQDKRARSAAACARLLGIHPNTMSRMRVEGADERTALACQALLSGLTPYRSTPHGD